MNDEQNNDDEMSMEELVETNDIVLNTLIDLLVEKKIISEEELQKKLNEE